jgi:RHS repeat-associated protein
MVAIDFQQLKEKYMNISKISISGYVIQTMSIILLLIWGVIFPIAGTVYADGADFGWVNTKAAPVSHEEAVRRLDDRIQHQQVERLFRKDAAQLFTATTTTLLADLAHGLQNDPALIYDYVHNHIDYAPYFGSLKGAALTMLDGSGNDFDQAALMIALLRHAGYTARFVYGTMSIPYEDLANWLGLENNPALICNFIASGGIPVSMPEDAALVDRVWVEAIIDGTPHLFDPAWKRYTETTGIDIGLAMGYNRETFLSSVTDGATVSSTHSQNLNTSGLAAELTDYSTNLVNTIQSQHPNATVDEIIGGRTIELQRMTDYPTALPFPTSNEQHWDEVPEAYTTTIRIRVNGIDETYITPEIAGKRLVLTYDGDSRPTLQLDGTVIATGNEVTTDDLHDMEIFIDHPYAALDGRYVDEAASNDPEFCGQSHSACMAPGRVKRSGTYALITAFGGTCDSLLTFRQQQLHQSLESGQPEGSEPVLGETLNIMGLTWMKETTLSNNIIAELAGVRSTTHHRMGLMSQEEGCSIDVKLQTVSTFARDDTDDADYFLASNLLNSGFEHGILEQFMGSDKPAVSTIKLLHIANAIGNPVYWVTGDTFEGIRDSLENYSEDDLELFQQRVNAGHVLVLPGDANLPLEQWTGNGYIDFHKASDNVTSILMAISGGYQGGYSASTGEVDPDFVNDNTQDFSNTDQNADTTPDVESAEPVDMATGAYLYDHTDLVIGRNAPIPISFSRSYTTGARLQKFGNNGFGYGWTHNHNIRLQESSNGNPALGRRTPADMAPMIAAIQANLDLLGNESTIHSWMVSSLTAKWAIDQLIDNVVTVSLGNTKMPFVKQPSGDFIAPPGFTTTLTKSGDSYILQERFGVTLTFAEAPDRGYRITTYQDIDGNRIDYTYSNDKLAEVVNNFGHTLILAYEGDRIVSISDSAGRTVAYGYTDNDLTSWTDPDGKISSYDYDQYHRMTRLRNPLDITMAVNTYNSRNQVIHQSVPRQGGDEVTYNFYFSGYRNVEEDPDGSTLVSYFDHQGRVIGSENKLGHRISLTYDGQDHIVAMTDAQGNRSSFAYDGHHNLISMVDPLNRKTSIEYDDQHRLRQVTDPLDHRVLLDYNDKHHLTKTTVHPQDGQSLTSEITYLASGLPDKTVDGRGITKSITYDEYANPVSSTIMEEKPVVAQYDEIGRQLSLTDQENNTTRFEYNGRGLLTSTTDPFGMMTEYMYNDDATLRSITDRNGETTTYTYTPARKIEQVTYADGSAVTLSYDKHNRPVTMADSLGTTTYTRDAAGRITAMTDANGQTVAYRYDENGNTGLLTTVIYPGNKPVTYTYDELNRLETVTNWLEQRATYTYDEAGRLISLVNFNGAVTTNTYDGADRWIASVSNTSGNNEIASFQYTLDGNGNRIKIEKQTPLSAPLPMRNQSAEYLHNRLAGTTTAVYDHDDEGRLATKDEDNTKVTYTFGSAHRLTGISDGRSFEYDGSGNRLRAVRSGVTTHYIYDIGGNLLAEADGDNNITRYYIHGAGLLAAITLQDAVYCYHYDGTGSTIAITDEDGEVANAYAYSPFGIILDTSEKFAQPFKYVGQYGVMTEADGLYYMRARYYDSDTGRFISEDPIGFGGGDVNLYGYVQNNPVNNVDPYGLSASTSAFNDLIGFLGFLYWGALQSFIPNTPTTSLGPGSIDTGLYVYDIVMADDPNRAAAMGFYDIILPWPSFADKMNSILYSFLTWGGNNPGGGALQDFEE